MIRHHLLYVLGLLAAGTAPLAAQLILDDFEDGDDNEWTRTIPLDPFGGTAEFSFPGGDSYRIKAGISPDPGALGGGRAGSFRPDVYNDGFHVSVDLIDWDDGIEQDIGLLANMTNPGAGTLDGYAFSYAVDAGEFFLSRLDGERATSLADFEAWLDPAGNYRLVLEGFQGTLRAALIDLAAPDVEVASVNIFDDDFLSGTCGLFVADGTGDSSGFGDATFDNYRSSADSDVDLDGMSDRWEFDFFSDTFFIGSDDNDGDGQSNLEEFVGGSDPTDAASRSGIARVSRLDGNLILTFPLVEGRSYSLESSPDLESWTPQPGAVFAEDGESATLTFPVGDQDPLFARVVATVR